MKRVLRTISLSLAALVLLAWLVLGANTGWTRTTEQVKVVDEVTGIEGIQWKRAFVPGLELLIPGLAAAGLVWATSIFVRTERKKQL